MALTVKYQVPILITALGITREVTDAVHAYGGLVFHDAINMQHARRALEMNVDGIIAVCNGAGGHAGVYNPFAFIGELRRSEEHTSELQSLMRISYAVFCLKKKIQYQSLLIITVTK